MDAPEIPKAPPPAHPLTGGPAPAPALVNHALEQQESGGFSVEQSVRQFAENNNIDEPVAHFLLCRMAGKSASEAERTAGITIIEFAAAVANHPEIREMVAVAMHQMGVDALYMANSLNADLIGEHNPPKGTVIAIKNYIAISRLGAPGYFAGKTARKGRRGQEQANKDANRKQMAQQHREEGQSLLARYKQQNKPNDTAPA